LADRWQGVKSRSVIEQRGGDRRGQRRFEIIGTCEGSLEIWRRLKVLNLGVGGALVESAESCAIDARLHGRLTLHGRRRDVRSEVRHCHAAPPDAEGRRYVLGLEFHEALSDMNEWLAAQPQVGNVAATDAVERRRSPRIESADAVDIEVAAWTTVELRDVSMSGALFMVTTSLDVGDKASFRTRLGDRRLDAEVEVRRVTRTARTGSRYGIGASFVSMDEESSHNLASFLGTPAN